MTAHTRLTPEQPIPIDLECGQCNYNLRGLKLENACPECGRPIRETLPGDSDVLIYQWTEQAAKRQARRGMVPMMLIFFFITMASSIWRLFRQWIDPSAPTISIADFLTGAIPFVVVFPVMIYFTSKYWRKNCSSYKLILSNIAVGRLDPPKPFVIIPHHHLRRIKKIPFMGLIVRTDDRHLKMPVPECLPGYDEITTQFESWGFKIKRSYWWISVLLIPPIMVLVNLGVFWGLSNRSKPLIVVGGVGFACLFAWGAYDMFYNRELAPVQKSILMLFFAALSLVFLISSLIMLLTP